MKSWGLAWGRWLRPIRWHIAFWLVAAAASIANTLNGGGTWVP